VGGAEQAQGHRRGPDRSRRPHFTLVTPGLRLVQDQPRRRPVCARGAFNGCARRRFHGVRVYVFWALAAGLSEALIYLSSSLGQAESGASVLPPLPLARYSAM